MTFKLNCPEDVLPITSGSFYASEQMTMKVECDNCPFLMERQGRPFLSDDRMNGIKLAQLLGRRFPCHKTTSATQNIYDGPEVGNWHRHHRQCRGALNWMIEFCADNGREIKVMK